MAKAAKPKSIEYLDLRDAYIEQQAAHENSIRHSEMLEKGWQQCELKNNELQAQLALAQKSIQSGVHLTGTLQSLDSQKQEQRINCQKELIAQLKDANIKLEEQLQEVMLENAALKKDHAVLQVKYSNAREITRDFRDSWNSSKQELKKAAESLQAKQSQLDEEQRSSLKAIQLIETENSRKKHDLNKITKAYDRMLAAKLSTKDASVNTEPPPTTEEQSTDVFGLSRGKEFGVQAVALDLPMLPVKNADMRLNQDFQRAGLAFNTMLCETKTRWADFESD